MKTIFKLLVTFICLLAQISFTYFIYLTLEQKYPIIRIIYSFFCLWVILKIIKDSRSYSFLLPWIIIFMIIPIPGSIIYLTIKLDKKLNGFIRRIAKEEKFNKQYLIQDKNIKEKYKDNSSMNYISDFCKFPITTNNKVKYYPLGDDVFETMINELKKAKEFIFLEYFIIDSGKFWDSILEVLEEKVKEGVEVRVMYDDLGCIGTLPVGYPRKLKKMGIKCRPFNSLRPFAGVVLNNRDHRKILVIDGKVAFSGGINLADEYININSKYGHWKDNAIKIEGDAVWNYTVMFLTMWNAVKKEDSSYIRYKRLSTITKENGFMAPYGDNPLDGENVGENVYLNIINNSNKYVYIFTPYLIIDSDIVDALILAAKRGVDVRIIIPGIPDKKMVYTISKSYIEPLSKGGVKVYFYTPGFVHSKVFVSDDIRATVGTFNMDYRSLYLHFECGCYFENVDVIKEIKKDLLNTIDKSKLVSLKEYKVGPLKSFWQSVLRLFAPFM